MSVTERVMAAGEWSLELVEDTPRRVLEAIDIEVAGFGQLVILPSRLDPRNHTDAGMLACARYTGLLRKQEGGFGLSGPGLPILLGDEDGKGDIFEVERSTANGYLTQWVESLRPISLSAGTTYSPGGSFTDTFYLVNAKTAFKAICDKFNVEWRVTPSFKLDVGSIENLYGSTPKLIILHNSGEGGRDFGLTGVRGVSGLTRDLEDYTTKAIVTVPDTEDVVTEQGSPTWVWDETLGEDVMTDISAPTKTTVTTDARTVGATAATPDAAIPYGRPSDGGPVVLDRLIESTSEDGTDGDPQTLADQQLGRFNSIRREITVEGGAYDVGHLSPVGSRIYLYAPPVIMDAAAPVQFRGRTCYPVTVRLMGLTWPITRGMGVYLRTSKGAVVWHDLTSYVAWESGDVQLEVDSMPRPSS